MKKFGLSILSALLLGVGTAMSAPAAAATIDLPSNGDAHGYLGPNSQSAYGEVFAAPERVLIDYSLTGWSLGGHFPFVSQIYSWNGTGVIGSALYTSAIFQMMRESPITFNFVPNLDLVAGELYVAIVTNMPDGVSLGGNDLALIQMSSAPTTTGFVYSWGDPRVTSNWNCGDGCGETVAFHADFSVAAAPEPSTWAMLLLGFACIGFVVYRQKSKTTLQAA